MTAPPPRALALVVGLALSALAGPARADDVQFGPNDISTVFYISKSDDKNRVDYAIRLDADCIPVGNSAVYGYWREFENAPPVRLHGLSLLDRIPYGISSQGIVTKSANGADYFIRLKQFERTIAIATKKEADGKCSATARAKINGAIAQFIFVYAKLAGPFSVEYIDIHGKDFATGAEIVERATK